MWKDFFYYSKSERRVILLLVFVAAVMIAVLSWKKVSSRQTVYMPDSCVIDTSWQLQKYKKVYSRYSSRRKDSAAVPVVILREFNPNTTDSVTFRQLGLPAYVARNILRYRAKGGVFRTPESFSRIYGLSEADYNRLRPYISLPLPENKIRIPFDSLKKIDSVADKKPNWLPKLAAGSVVDLNKADTTLLKRIPGIGSGLAKMIVSYRERLGGFYKVEQLQDLSYLDKEMNVWFSVSSEDTLRKIHVNHAHLEELRHHPYMNFYKAKVILDYRRKRGEIKGPSQLSMFEEFTEKDLDRLLPYLSFD